LEPRAAKCIFLGYQPSVKSYKLWNPQTRKIVLSRNIIFNESAMFITTYLLMLVLRERK
jgi:hypothetical protein